MPVLVLDGDGVYGDRDVLRRRNLTETLRSGIVPKKYILDLSTFTPGLKGQIYVMPTFVRQSVYCIWALFDSSLVV